MYKKHVYKEYDPPREMNMVEFVKKYPLGAVLYRMNEDNNMMLVYAMVSSCTEDDLIKLDKYRIKLLSIGQSGNGCFSIALSLDDLDLLLLTGEITEDDLQRADFYDRH